MLPIQPQTFDHLKTFDGLSERSLREHLKLYHGYVAKYNDLTNKLRGLRAAGQPHADPDIESLKTDITFTLGNIKNHELFFDILGQQSGEPRGPLAQEIAKSFHSVPQFLDDLRHTAICARGWAWTAYDLDYHHLFNYQAAAHGGLPVWNAVPILALDLSGHAYFYDFGNNKIAYIEVLMKAIHWPRVARRLEAAAKI